LGVDGSLIFSAILICQTLTAGAAGFVSSFSVGSSSEEFSVVGASASVLLEDITVLLLVLLVFDDIDEAIEVGFAIDTETTFCIVFDIGDRIFCAFFARSAYERVCADVEATILTVVIVVDRSDQQ
jgi:hypothetical protein